jgi:hypothetical protein
MSSLKAVKDLSLGQKSSRDQPEISATARKRALTAVRRLHELRRKTVGINENCRFYRLLKNQRVVRSKFILLNDLPNFARELF